MHNAENLFFCLIVSICSRIYFFLNFIWFSTSLSDDDDEEDEEFKLSLFETLLLNLKFGFFGLSSSWVLVLYDSKIYLIYSKFYAVEISSFTLSPKSLVTFMHSPSKLTLINFFLIYTLIAIRN